MTAPHNSTTSNLNHIQEHACDEIILMDFFWDSASQNNVNKLITKADTTMTSDKFVNCGSSAA